MNKSKISCNKKSYKYGNTSYGKFIKKIKEILFKEINIKEHFNILDVGCGDGTFLKMIFDKYNVKAYGVDTSNDRIETLNTKYPNMTFKVSDYSYIAFNSETFDVITTCNPYNNFSNIKKFAEESNRLLKKNGFLYIANIYCPPLLRNIINIFLFLSTKCGMKIYSRKEIRNNFKEYGFKEIEYVKKGCIQIIKMKKLRNY